MHNCHSCGSLIEDGTGFCPNCGAPTGNSVQTMPSLDENAASQAFDAPASGNGEPKEPERIAITPDLSGQEAERKAMAVFKLGLFSVILCWTVVCSFVGIALGIAGLISASAYTKKYGQLKGKGLVGKYLSLGGLIVSPIICILFIAAL